MSNNQRITGLPYMSGDTVYAVCSWGIEEAVVGNFEFVSGRLLVNNNRSELIGEARNVYLTREQAVSALPERIRFRREAILDNVTYKMVNAEKNVSWLASVPHKRCLDLEAVYCVDGSTVNGVQCTQYGISTEELDDAARKNMKRVEYLLRTLDSMMPGFLSESPLPFYVVINREMRNAASVLMLPQELEQIADALEDSLYILPSSVHELIVVPVSLFPYARDIVALRQIVGGVNVAAVPDEDFLSNSVYLYDKALKSLNIV